jgi:hypothetical protein
MVGEDTWALSRTRTRRTVHPSASRAATELIEWELGKASQQLDIGNKDGKAFEYKLVYPDDATNSTD